MHVFFEDDGQLKAGTVLADHDASLQVEAASGKRLKIKAATCCCASPRRRRRCSSRTRRSSRELDPNFLWEVSRRRRVRLRRARARILRHAPTPVEAAAVALPLHAAPMHFYKRGKGRYRKAPRRRARGRARVGRAQAARGRADRRVGATSSRADAAARRDARRSFRCCSTSRTRTRSSGRRSPRRATRADESGGAARRVRRDPLDARLPLQRVPREAFPQGARVRRVRRAAAAARAAGGRRARVLDRRRDDDRDRRCVLGARAGQRPLRDRHPHRRAGARRFRAASPLDAMARARLSTVYMPGRKLTMLPDDVVDAFTLAEGRSPPALSLYVGSRRPTACSSGTRRASIACRSPPICVSTRSTTRSRTICRRRPIRRGRPSSACCGSSRNSCRRARQERHRAHRLQLRRRLGPSLGRRREQACAHRPAPARQSARQARRRAHDPRQQHVGQAARRREGGGPLPHAGRTARSR